MSQPPPLLPEARRRRRRSAKIVIAIVCSLVVLAAAGIFLLVRYVTASGITRPFDNKFGDQHLKTTVALVELHKVRHGRYPPSLRDLRFTGEWDQIALKSVRYYAAPDGSSYFVEVTRGWVGKPVLDLPPDFWKGTGYSPAVKPPSE